MEDEPTQRKVVAGRYALGEFLGRGGTASVFSGEDLETGRHVALKIARPEDQQAGARAFRQAWLSDRIDSHRCSRAIELVDDDERGVVLVLERLHGESMIERLKRQGPMTIEQLYPIVAGLLEALGDVHDAGVVHRNVMPSSVYLESHPSGERIKLIDFCCAKLVCEKQIGAPPIDLSKIQDISLGLFSFMAPEAIGKFKQLDIRWDIYSLGTLVFQALSGQLPYAAKNILQLVDMKTKSAPRTLSEVIDGDVHPYLQWFIAKCLAWKPDDRFLSAHEAAHHWRQLATEAEGHGPATRHTRARNALKAHVRNGRLVLDEPTTLPEGAEVWLVPADDGESDDEERTELDHAPSESIDAVRAGDMVDGPEFIDQPRAKTR